MSAGSTVRAAAIQQAKTIRHGSMACGRVNGSTSGSCLTSWCADAGEFEAADRRNWLKELFTEITATQRSKNIRRSRVQNLRNERLAVLYGGRVAHHRLRAGLDRQAGRQRARAGSPAAGDRGLCRQRGASHRPLHRGGERPQRRPAGAEQALHLAKVTGATLVIAKLDRLSRNAAFLLTLRDSGVRFSAVDLPEANDLTVGIMALVAQQEREAISRRTKEALAVARSRGVRLGNPNGIEALGRAGKGTAPLRAAIARNADRHAQDLAPVIEDIRAGGATSLRAIAAELNGRGMLTRRGGRWHVSTVMNLLDRLGLREAACASPG